jgi:hypothetical protein
MSAAGAAKGHISAQVTIASMASAPRAPNLAMKPIDAPPLLARHARTAATAGAV